MHSQTGPRPSLGLALCSNPPSSGRAAARASCRTCEHVAGASPAPQSSGVPRAGRSCHPFSLGYTSGSSSSGRQRRLPPLFAQPSASGSLPVPGDKRGPDTSRLAASVALVLLLGVSNRVLNKMALVPLGNHLFALAQLQTCAYVIIYASILYSRRKAGLVTPRMLQVPDKRLFLLIGLLEAAAQLISLVCVSKLPGVVLPLLQQTILLWQVALGYLLQGQRFQPVQVLGILLVAGGVAKAAWPAGQGGSVLGQADPRFAAFYCCAFLILALVAIVKDHVFRDARKKLQGRSLDLFVVNTSSSACQALFVFLLLPVLSSLRGIPFAQLPAHLHEGARAFLGQLPGSQGAPLIPLLYIACNLGMNVSVLNLLRTAGPVVTTLSMSVLVPLSIWAFTWPWPLIGAPARLTPNFLVGTLVLLAGIAAYNWPNLRPQGARS